MRKELEYAIQTQKNIVKLEEMLENAKDTLSYWLTQLDSDELQTYAELTDKNIPDDF